jgi:transposase
MEGGIEGLLKRGKAPGKATPLADKAVVAALQEGLRAGRWRTVEQIRQWLKSEYGIERKLKAVYAWVGKSEGVLKVPRPVHIKKDETAAQAFKVELCERLQSQGLPEGKPVKVWVLDEARYGLHSVTRRCWGLKGERTVIPKQQKFSWGYVYGAVEVLSGKAEFLLMPTVNLAAHEVFLQHLAQSDEESHHIIIQDQAGFHYRSGDARLPERVHVVSLPPYSPELNPVEKLWDHLKDALCNQVFTTLTEIEGAISQWTTAAMSDTRRMRALIGQGWLHTQVNVL